LKKFQLPAYELRVEDGQYCIDFKGNWADVTLWEIPVLSIISELRSRAALQGMPRFELDVLYARAKSKLWEKVLRLDALPDLKIADFGTRRRHSFLWQRWCIAAMAEGLGKKFIGTSNVLMAMDLDLDAIGTNAHELPMVEAALASDDHDLKLSPYRVLESWSRTYDGNLLIVLPDTGCAVEWFQNRFKGTYRWRRRTDHMVEISWPGPSRKAAYLFRRSDG